MAVTQKNTFANKYGRGGMGQGIIHRQVRLTSTGSAGSAVATAFQGLPPGRLIALKVDYHASAPATTDLTIRRDSSSGTALFTNANSATDVPMRALGTPNAIDEGRAAVAATDATDGGGVFKDGLYFDIAQSDALTAVAVIDVFVEVMELIEGKLRPTGSAGSATTNRDIRLNKAGIVSFVELDFGSGVPATADVVLKADDTNGEVMLTSTNSATDLAPSALGLIGVDETNAVIAATDGSCGGHPFRRGVRFEVAQADPYVDATDEIIYRLWCKT